MAITGSQSTSVMRHWPVEKGKMMDYSRGSVRQSALSILQQYVDESVGKASVHSAHE